MNLSLQHAIDRGRGIYRGWWIVVTCYFAQMVATGAPGWVFGILIAPMGAELGWSRSEIVLAISISSLVGGLLAAPIGPVMDRYGPRVLMTASLAVAGTMMLLLALVQERWQYYLIWLVIGLASPGFGNLGPVVALANWFIRRRALAFMYFTFGSATAGIVLTRIAAYLAPAYGWRFVWTLFGLFVWLLVPLAWTTIRRRPEDVGLLPDGDRAPPEGSSTRDARADACPPAPVEEQWTLREALHTRAFWCLTFGFTLIGGPAASIFVHMAPYVVLKGHTLADGAAVTSWYGIGVLGGRPVYGFLIGKVGIHRTLVIFAATYGAVIFGFLVPTGLVAIEAMVILLGIAVAGSQQLQAQALPDYFGRTVVGALSGYAGVAITVSRSIGPMLGALAFDMLGSYVLPFSGFGVACFVAAFAFALAPPPRRASRVPR